MIARDDQHLMMIRREEIELFPVLFVARRRRRNVVTGSSAEEAALCAQTTDKMNNEPLQVRIRYELGQPRI